MDRVVLLFACIMQVANAQESDDLSKYAARAVAEQNKIVDSIKVFSIPEAEKKLEAAKKGKLGKHAGVNGSNYNDTVYFYEGHKVSFANREAKREYIAKAESELADEKNRLESYNSGTVIWRPHLPPGKPTPGSIGRLPYTAKVIQILGETKALVELRLLSVDPSNVGEPVLVMISGVDFTGVKDDTDFQTNSIFVVGQPETYRTILGTERSAFTFSVVSDSKVSEAIIQATKLEAKP